MRWVYKRTAATIHKRTVTTKSICQLKQFKQLLRSIELFSSHFLKYKYPLVSSPSSLREKIKSCSAENNEKNIEIFINLFLNFSILAFVKQAKLFSVLHNFAKHGN